MIIVYSLPNCPNCEHLKEVLKTTGYDFEERPMDSAESITDMRIEGCFAMEAPVLKVNDKYFEYKDIKDNILENL
jgi:glutaredoxin